MKILKFFKREEGESDETSITYYTGTRYNGHVKNKKKRKISTSERSDTNIENYPKKREKYKYKNKEEEKEKKRDKKKDKIKEKKRKRAKHNNKDNNNNNNNNNNNKDKEEKKEENQSIKEKENNEVIDKLLKKQKRKKKRERKENNKGKKKRKTEKEENGTNKTTYKEEPSSYEKDTVEDSRIIDKPRDGTKGEKKEICNMERKTLTADQHEKSVTGEIEMTNHNHELSSEQEVILDAHRQKLWESNGQWERRKNFILKMLRYHKHRKIAIDPDKFAKMGQIFYNITYLDCKYDAQLHEEVRIYENS